MWHNKLQAYNHLWESYAERSLKCTWREIFFTSLFKRALKVMKNGIYFIVIAFLVAQLFKVLVYAN